MNGVNMGKPAMKYEEGQLKFSMGAGVDTDKDGIMAAEGGMYLNVNAMEAVNEILKKDVPEWFTNILKLKGII